MSLGRIRYGTHAALEEAADQLLYEALKNTTSRNEKSDILTPWKAKHRLAHEVYTLAGVPDASVRQGMYHRTLNRAKPHLNSRDGIARGAISQDNPSIALRHFTGASNDD